MKLRLQWNLLKPLTVAGQRNIGMKITQLVGSICQKSRVKNSIWFERYCFQIELTHVSVLPCNSYRVNRHYRQLCKYDSTACSNQTITWHHDFSADAHCISTFFSSLHFPSQNTYVERKFHLNSTRHSYSWYFITFWHAVSIFCLLQVVFRLQFHSFSTNHFYSHNEMRGDIMRKCTMLLHCNDARFFYNFLLFDEKKKQFLE